MQRPLSKKVKLLKIISANASICCTWLVISPATVAHEQTV